MKKRLNFKVLGAIIGMLLFTASGLWAQNHMFITTKSEEAREDFIIGRERIEKLQYKQSMDFLKNAIEIDPEFALAHLYYAWAKTGGASFSENHLKKAVELVDKVSLGEKHQILYAKAFANNNGLAMNKHIMKLNEMFPKDERVQTWVGQYYYTNKDFKKAREHLNVAYRLNNEYHPAVNILGYTYMNMDKPNKAEKKFKEYISLIPANANPYDSYAEFLLRQGRFDESIVNYEKALDYNPDFLASYKGLGDNHLFTEDYKKANEYYQKYYDKAINDNQKFHALALQASVDIHQNNRVAAMNKLDKYIQLAEELDKTNYKVYGIAYKGYVLTETGKPSEGLKHYRQAMDMVEEANLPEQTRENLRTTAYMWNYYALTANDNLKDAEDMRNKCKQRISEEKNKNQWKMYNSICGIMELKKGNYDKAKAHLEESFNNPTTWYYTGLVWEKQGNERKAQKYYEKVANHYNNTIELAPIRNKAMAGIKE
jgi:tetratricopeptide (TPR) repeat protein